MNTSLGTGVLLPQTVIPPLPNPPIPTVANMGTPVRWTTNPGGRKQYLQSQAGHYLEIYPNGTIQGNLGVKTMFGIIVFLSFVTDSANGDHSDTIVIKGLVSNLYLCMDNRSLIYASKIVTSDCAFLEDLKNNHNVFYHASHRQKRKKFYLGIDRHGLLKPGLFARYSQKFSQFLPVPVKPIEDSRAKMERARLAKRGPITLVKKNNRTPDPEKRRKNERRRRRRRWCSKLQKIVNNPEKYKARCKHFCEVLHIMISNYPKHKNRCKRAQKRRNSLRRRKRKNRTKRHNRGDRKRGREGRNSSKRRRRKDGSKRQNRGDRKRGHEGRRQRNKRKLREYQKSLEQSRSSTLILTAQSPEAKDR